MTDIATDWRGRATYGGLMAEDYLAEWFPAHPDHKNLEGEWVEAGFWAQDDRKRWWWVTDTPDFDRHWFIKHGVRPPKRIGSPEHSYFEDVGNGLGRGSYDPHRTYPRSTPGVLIAEKLDPGESVSFTVEVEEPD